MSLCQTTGHSIAQRLFDSLPKHTMSRILPKRALLSSQVIPGAVVEKHGMHTLVKLMYPVSRAGECSGLILLLNLSIFLVTHT